MREIKFRGKRKDNGEWIYGGFVKNLNHKCYIIDYEHVYTIETEEIINNGVYEVIPETVGQYIGKKDKNGKEIYSKDYIRGKFVYENDNKPLPIRGLVIYDEDLSGFGLKNQGGVTLLFRLLANKIEVVGNKYDNPELLEG